MFPTNKIAVIGDVHGCLEELRVVLNKANFEDRFPVFLGDLTDRGPDSVGVMRTVMDMSDRNECAVIFGNHDDKLMRLCMGNDINLTGGIETTYKELLALPGDERTKLQKRFVNTAQDWWEFLTVGNVSLVHGGWHPGMLDFNPGVRVRDRKDKGVRAMVARANYGKIDKDKPKTSDGFPARDYSWINEIPNGHTVYLGHDVVSTTEIVTMTGDLGGKAVFVDTGAGKAGFLSSLNVDLE